MSLTELCPKREGNDLKESVEALLSITCIISALFLSLCAGFGGCPEGVESCTPLPQLCYLQQKQVFGDALFALAFNCSGAFLSVQPPQGLFHFARLNLL